MVITYCCDNCRTRYRVELSGLRDAVSHLRCPNCGLAEVNPEEPALTGYTIENGELVKK